jgi:DDE superfamily endonuclease
VVVDKATRQVICIHTSEGRRHDSDLLKKSRVRFKPGTITIEDSGYQGVQKDHKNSLLPFKKPKKRKLTKNQKRFNKRVAQERILNEHVIGALKRFRIISECYRNRRKRFGLRFNLIAVIYNMDIE